MKTVATALTSMTIVLALATSPSCAADQKPRFSLVYDTKENSGLQIKCTETTSAELTCDFKQISIFKKAKENELQKAIEDARQQFKSAPKDQPAFPKGCSEFENTLSYMRDGKANLSADVKANIDKMTGRDRQDMEQTTALIAAFCKNPTEENLVNVARFTHQKDAKTCKILTANFSQTFQRVTADSWVSKEGPDGLCGVVTISRLERVGAGSTSFWVYTTNRVVTNKSSSTSPQICKSLEEGEHFFDWKGGGDRFLGCDYIEMGF
jgi:hypothetical protein